MEQFDEEIQRAKDDEVRCCSGECLKITWGAIVISHVILVIVVIVLIMRGEIEL